MDIRRRDRPPIRPTGTTHRNTATAATMAMAPHQPPLQARRPHRQRRKRKPLRRRSNHDSAFRAAAGQHLHAAAAFLIILTPKIKTAPRPFGHSAISISARSATAYLSYPSAAGVGNLIYELPPTPAPTGSSSANACFCDLPRSISICPFKYAPSSISTRPPVMFPTTEPSFFTSTRSSACRLPRTLPYTITSRACTSETISPFCPTVRRWPFNEIGPSTLPSICKSSSPEIWPFTVNPGPKIARLRAVGALERNDCDAAGAGLALKLADDCGAG